MWKRCGAAGSGISGYSTEDRDCQAQCEGKPSKVESGRIIIHWRLPSPETFTEGVLSARETLGYPDVCHGL